MNELLAIILIVILCCAIFFAWLLSMATCPDKMVNWLSGTAGNSTCTTSYESKELIVRDDDSPPDGSSGSVPSQSVFLQLGNVGKRGNSKKLSVVPEQDEQLTVTSISQILYPTVHRQSSHGSSSNGNNNKNLNARLTSHFEQPGEEHDQDPVVVVVSENNASAHNSPQQSGDRQLGELPPRYHYSAPAIHVV